MEQLSKAFPNFNLFRRNTYPDDKIMNKLISNSKKLLLNAHRNNKNEHKYIKEMLVLNELTLPQEFRNSIFNNEFYHGNTELNEPFKFQIKDKYLGNYNFITNRLYLYFNADEMAIFNYIDDNQMFESTLIFNTNYGFYCCNCNIQFNYKQHINNDMYIAVDCIQGLYRNFDYRLCYTCYENIYNLNIIKETNLTRDISNIIKKYIKNTVYKLENFKTTYKFPYTSTLFDWICFMYLNREEDSIYWLINCNKKSKFYGYILMYGHQYEFEIVCHIKKFCEPEFYIEYCKNILKSDGYE